MTLHRELTAQDITPEFVESFYENYIEGWFDTGAIDWDSVLSEYEKDVGKEAAHFPDQWTHPVITQLKRAIHKIRNQI